MKKISALLIFGILFSSSLCNSVFADTKNGENAFLVKLVKQIESSSGNHSKTKCCDENNDQKNIENLLPSSNSTSIKQNFTDITKYIAFRKLDVKEISLKDPPLEYSGIKNSTENVILRE